MVYILLIIHTHTLIFLQPPNEKDQTRILYYNKVLLGKMYEMRELDQELQSAPVDYHSVHGIHPGRPQDDEFIVYR